jgi:opacity protein-like surface antigen
MRRIVWVGTMIPGGFPMRHRMKIVALMLSLGVQNARAQEPIPEIMPEEVGGPVAAQSMCCCYEDQFYVAGIIGSSFGTLTVPDTPSANNSLFTAGGALGHSWEVEDGFWRLEVEGRHRDPISQQSNLDDFDNTSTVSATGGWSATVNIWRDYNVHDRVTCYVGGGIGGGGYQFGINQDFPVQDATFTGLGTVTGFAWQAGGGVAWAITDGLTLDLGYRFFDLGAGGVTGQLAQSGIPIDTTQVTSAFSASELFFAFRIYDPLQGWW